MQIFDHPQLHLDNDAHTYTYKGQKFISVSSLVRQIFPEFQPDQVLDKNCVRWQSLGSKYYGKTRQDIKDIWDLASLEATKSGTALHEQIAKYLNTPEPGPKNPTSPEFLQFIKFTQDFPLMFQLGRHIEKSIVLPSAELAGTFDLLLINENTNECSLIDWKRTSKCMKNEKAFGRHAIWGPLSLVEDTRFNRYSLQLNFYRHILRLHYNLNVTEMLIVQFHPELPNYVITKCPVIDKEILEFYLSTDLEVNQCEYCSSEISKGYDICRACCLALDVIDAQTLSPKADFVSAIYNFVTGLCYYLIA